MSTSLRDMKLDRTTRAADELDEAARNLARARRFARLVQWRFDAEARSFRWSTGSAEIFAGVEGEGTPAQVLLRWVHPDDRARVEAALFRPSAHSVEYRLVLPSGEARLVNQTTDAEVDALTGRTCLVGTAQDVTELRAAEEQVTHLAYYDELTRLPNRAHVCRFLKAALATARARGQRIAIVSLDLDFFRRVNDSLGHVAGNAVLKDVADRLQRTVFEEMTRQGRPEAMVARLGGDEFAVILRDIRSDEEAATLFRQLACDLSAPFRFESSRIVLSVSAGISVYPASGSDVDALLLRADAAMHVAKEKGRGRCQLFAAEISEKLRRRVDVESRLRAALASGHGLELHYQPKVEASTRRVVGVEALLRWTPDALGAISPTELVTVAEETGLMIQLGDWVLRTACVQAKAWSVASALAVPIAVNISARQFSAVDFVEKVTRVLEETGLSPARLDLEVTESVMMIDVAATGRMLEQLKALGVHVTLDDFGTGYSSLAYLTRFPIDTLKVDRSFVMEIGVASKSEAIVSAIVALSRSLGIEVVAEGVETEAQRAFLACLGPLTIQGWLFSKALPAEAALAWIARHEAGLAHSE